MLAIRIALSSLACLVMFSASLSAQEPPSGPVVQNGLPPGAPMMINGRPIKGVAPEGLLAPADSDWSGDGALVAAGAIRIINRATAPLGLAFYDMQEWKVVRLRPSRQAEIACERCEAIIQVQFHDGRAAKRFKLDLEREYVLGWSNNAGSWVLKPAE